MKRWDHETERDVFYKQEAERRRKWLEQRKTKEIWYNRVGFVNGSMSLECLKHVGGREGVEVRKRVTGQIPVGWPRPVSELYPEITEG